MSEDISNPNLEWKKGTHGVKETITRKTNLMKAVAYDAKKQQKGKGLLPPSPAELPKGLKKIRKKIKDVFDEDEDEDENSYVTLQDTALLDQDHNSLLSALNENEKKQLQQKETIFHNKMQQDAGKMEGLMQAEKVLKNAGLAKINNKVKAQAMQDVRLNQDMLGRAIEQTAPKKLNVSMKKLKKMSVEEKKKLVQGISLMKKVGGEKALQGTKVDELLVVGDKKTNEKEVAKIILEKTGRKTPRKISKIRQEKDHKEIEKQVVNTRKRNRERTY